MSNTHGLLLARKDLELSTTEIKSYDDRRHILEDIISSTNQHSNIIECLASVENWLTYSIFMPLADCNLEQYMEQNPFLHSTTVEKAILMERAVGLAEAVIYLQDELESPTYGKLSCFSLDLKPRNILVVTEPDDGKQRWKLSSFGMSLKKATRIRERKTATQLYSRRRSSQTEIVHEINTLFRRRPRESDTGSIIDYIGSLRGDKTYLAPEVCLKDYPVYKESDLWSLGCILSVLLSYLQGGNAAVREFAQLREASGVDTFFIFPNKPTFYGSGLSDFKLSDAVREWRIKLLLRTGPMLRNEAAVFTSLIEYLDRKVLIVDPKRRRQTTVRDVRDQLINACNDFHNAANASSIAHQPSNSRIRSLGMRKWLRRRLDGKQHAKEEYLLREEVGGGSSLVTVEAFRIPIEEHRSPFGDNGYPTNEKYLELPGAQNHKEDIFTSPKKGNNDQTLADLDGEDEESVWLEYDGSIASAAPSIHSHEESGIEEEIPVTEPPLMDDVDDEDQAEEDLDIEYGGAPEPEIPFQEDKRRVISTDLPWIIDKVFESLSVIHWEPPIPKGCVRARWICVSMNTFVWFLDTKFHRLVAYASLTTSSNWNPVLFRSLKRNSRYYTRLPL
jgi:serine/threonine protein kinase